jgi:(2Fe-2S) ferredoxin
MQIEPTPHAMHVFVCQHAREEGLSSCGAQGGADILSALKRLCRERNLGLRVSGSGCLGPCEKGPNVMVYPHKLWFQAVRQQDLPDLVDELERQLPPASGGAVARPAVD